jgi:hypothetical protein
MMRLVACVCVLMMGALSVSAMSAKSVPKLPEGGLKPTLSCDLASPAEAGFAKAGNFL